MVESTAASAPVAADAAIAAAAAFAAAATASSKPSKMSTWPVRAIGAPEHPGPYPPAIPPSLELRVAAVEARMGQLESTRVAALEARLGQLEATVIRWGRLQNLVEGFVALLRSMSSGIGVWQQALDEWETEQEPPA